MRGFPKKVILCVNGNSTDREAYFLLKEAGIDFVLAPTADISEPSVIYGIWEYEGLKEIKRFIERYKKGELPPLRIQ